MFFNLKLQFAKLIEITSGQFILIFYFLLSLKPSLKWRCSPKDSQINLLQSDIYFHCKPTKNENKYKANIPVEFFRAMSSALDVFLWSIRRFGILNGGTFILSWENWCLKGRCLSGDGIDKLSSFNLFRWCRSIWSNISCNTYGIKNITKEKRIIESHCAHLMQN